MDENCQFIGEVIVIWIYVVINIGNIILVDLEVVDDQEGVVGIIVSFVFGVFEILEILVEVGLWQYMNFVIVIGQLVGVDGNFVLIIVMDEDLFYYIGFDINIEKIVDKMEICVGEEVIFIFMI